jgi:hypothetical protein
MNRDMFGETVSPLSAGMLGVKTGLTMSVLFSPTLTPLLTPRGGWQSIEHFLHAIPSVIWLLGFVFGGLPAMIIGFITGYIIQKFHKTNRTYYKSLFTAFSVCIGILISLEIFLGGIQMLIFGSFFYVIHLPYLLYILSGLWIGEFLYKRNADLKR